MKTILEQLVDEIPTAEEASINLAEAMGIKIAKTMGKTVDRELFFPMPDYEKRHLSKWDKFKLWKEEMEQRIQLAIEVLKGRHYCSD